MTFRLASLCLENYESSDTLINWVILITCIHDLNYVWWKWACMPHPVVLVYSKINKKKNRFNRLLQQQHSSNYNALLD